jgi:hypothetical protein
MGYWIFRILERATESTDSTSSTDSTNSTSTTKKQNNEETYTFGIDNNSISSKPMGAG